MYEPTLAPGECIVSDYGNQVVIGPCSPNDAAVGVGVGGFFLVSIAAGIFLYTEADRRRQLYRRTITALEGEL